MNHSAFQEQLSCFPFDAALILQQLEKQSGRLDPQQITDLCTLLNIPPSGLLKALMPLAASMSTCSISGFHVGAIVEGYREDSQGPFYLGANFEMAGQPLKMTIHAEQSAISNAWHQGETRLRRLYVNEAPCGHCRQFMNELNQVESMEFVVNQLENDEQKVYQISDLLPDAFGPADLEQEERLLSASIEPLDNPEPEDALVTAATQAASQSYAPYSGCRSGIALLLETGDMVTGQYAENVAFNPGMTAIEAALCNMRLNNLGKPDSKVTDAVLVEASSVTSHQTTTASILADIGAELRYYTV
ncbi:hypothetical protein ACH42_02055 [Endozoicomonas sp. (ex Bugula neritina AB1)]|nr:hypothetical protein ACH42_02055 [Endozoicomonas sp. (ex Bugula neritina AB1)]